MDPLTPGGIYPVALTITDTETGDLLTVQEALTVTVGSFPTYNIVIPADRQALLDPTLVQQEREKVGRVSKTFNL